MAENAVESGQLKTGTTKVGASNVLTPRESLTYQNCEKFEELVNGLINKNQTRIIIDCKAIPFIDSKALELLLRLQSTLKTRGGTLKITGLNAVCRDILLATRLVNVLHVYEDIAEALRSYP